MPPRHIRVNADYARGAMSKKIVRPQYAAMARRPHFIRQWRNYRNLTQEQLAERIGVDQSYLSKIENGKRDYDQAFLEAAAEALRCEAPDLLMRDPTDPDGIWSVWDALEPVQRRQVVELAKVIKGTGTDG